TAFNWPTLTVRATVAITPNQTLYAYDSNLKFEQIRSVVWGLANTTQTTPVEYGIREEHLRADGTNTIAGASVLEWETVGEDNFRVWPTPQVSGFLRMKGNRPLDPFVSNTDMSTLDATCISLFVAAELLTRAKADDAQMKAQKAQRHLVKLLGNQITAKNKVSTLGADRAHASGLRPYLDYIPERR
ncbi:MAG: hypothetical protein N2444_09760, partial [Methylocystis sp.]|nr:hypothetical protein [Methylocystis sp.]